MNRIELQSENPISKGENSVTLYNLGKTEAVKLIVKKKLLMITLTISIAAAVSTAVAVTVVYVTKSSSEEKKDNDIKKEYKKEDFYTERTKAYYDLIKNLEEENAILYHWNLEKDENTNKAIFKDKYQHLYDYSTDLKPVNESIGYYLHVPENYRTIDTDLLKYYKAINETIPDHLIYGPSINDKKFAKAQTLYSDNIKINNKKSKKGFSISFNIKKELDFSTSVSADLFGFNTQDNKKGLSVTIAWAVIFFKAGSYSSSYTRDNSIQLGYDENDPNIKYLSFRPFYNNRWHHICIVQKVLGEDDLVYFKDKKVGDVMGEYFLDGMSRKNFSGGLLDDYGNLTVFSFSEDEEMIGNVNFYIDEMMVFNKSLKKEEIKVLYDLIDQDTERVIPKVASVDCKMPGKQCGPLPTDICPESKEKSSAEVKVFHYTNKWTCLGINFNNFLMDRITEFYGENLRIVDINRDEGKLQEWQLQDHYLFSTLDVIKYYLPEIEPIFTNLTSFSNYVTVESTDLNGGNKKIHKMVNYGYWISQRECGTSQNFMKNLRILNQLK